MKAHELNLESPVFAHMLLELDHEIKHTVKNMREKGMSEGAVTAKIKIHMMNGVDENGDIHTTVIFEPKVSAKIESTTEEKIGPTGGRVTIGTDGELMIGSEQVTMDEIIQKGA